VSDLDPFAVVPDRISGQWDSFQKVCIKTNKRVEEIKKDTFKRSEKRKRNPEARERLLLSKNIESGSEKGNCGTQDIPNSPLVKDEKKKGWIDKAMGMKRKNQARSLIRTMNQTSD